MEVAAAVVAVDVHVEEVQVVAVEIPVEDQVLEVQVLVVQVDVARVVAAAALVAFALLEVVDQEVDVARFASELGRAGNFVASGAALECATEEVFAGASGIRVGRASLYFGASVASRTCIRGPAAAKEPRARTRNFMLLEQMLTSDNS